MPSLMEMNTQTWQPQLSENEQQETLATLELGAVLWMPKLAFELLPSEKRFLSPDCADGKAKNISFDPRTQLLRGAACSGEEAQALTGLLKRFSHQAHDLITHLFPRYASHVQPARTSYRPVEIEGRVTSYRKDDTRLHVDAFPATPNQGKRILRVFSNIHPHDKPRVWRLGEPFEEVVKQFLPRVKQPFPGLAQLLRVLKLTKGTRSLYDHMMLQIHDQMKADLTYQATASQSTIHFMPNTTWIVQTDHVSHAAMSGQYVLEQTYYLPIHAMQSPEHAPLRVLERLTNVTLV